MSAHWSAGRPSSGEGGGHATRQHDGMMEPGRHGDPSGAGATTTLSAEASSAGTARRFVSDVLRNRGMEDLADVAALLTSELVTNAVLHARSAIVLEVRCSSPCVRIQVRDTSSEPAVRRVGRPSAAVPGRGLQLVGALAVSWGSQTDARGKCVWFELRSPQTETGTELRQVMLIGVPAATYVALNLHVDQLLHELQMATAAGTWSQTAHSGRLHRLITRSLHSEAEARASAWAQARQALSGPAARVDIELRVPVSAAAASRQLLELLEEGDDLCSAGELLTLPATSEVKALRRWVSAELWSQLHLGGEPQPCPL